MQMQQQPHVEDRTLQELVMEFVKKYEVVLRAMVAEMIGVLLFCVVTFGMYMVEYPILANSVLIGFTHASIMQGTIYASGGHINPAVTLGFLTIQWITVNEALLYWLGQFIGSIACLPVLRLIYQELPEETTTVATTWNHLVEPETTQPTPSHDWPGKVVRFNQWTSIALKWPTTAFQGFCIEFFSGVIIMLAYCAAHDPARPSEKLLGTLAVGAAVTGGHLLAYNFTGGGINPARILTIAYCEEEYGKYFIYMVGPATGCVAGAFLYNEAITQRPEIVFRPNQIF